MLDSPPSLPFLLTNMTKRCLHILMQSRERRSDPLIKTACWANPSFHKLYPANRSWHFLESLRLRNFRVLTRRLAFYSWDMFSTSHPLILEVWAFDWCSRIRHRGPLNLVYEACLGNNRCSSTHETTELDKGSRSTMPRTVWQFICRSLRVRN